MDKDFIEKFSQALKGNVSQGGVTIIGGEAELYKDISNEDLPLWKEFIRFGDDQSIRNILLKKKAYLLTTVIGGPSNQLAQKILVNNEAAYGNIALHNRMANSHDQSIVKVEHLTEEKKELLTQNEKGAIYLLSYYEMKRDAARNDYKKAPQKIAEIEQAICAKDFQGKTPLLLACKTANQAYAIRLIDVDLNKKTIDLSDNIKKQTPLHIACILGLTEVAQKLIALGANQQIVDNDGHTPFYYLTCSEQEKLGYIKEVLDSVNFFFGRYFGDDAVEKVTHTLLDSNKSLQNKLAPEQEQVSVSTTLPRQNRI